MKFILAFLAALALLFFTTSSSYQLSLKARFYYEIGDFNESLRLSQDALDLDKYNKMAQTLINKNQISIQFSNYIKSGENYLKKIESFSQKGISNSDRQRIALMCEVMIEGFDALPSGMIISKGLKEDAKKMQENFINLKRELF